jgi:Fic family protein
LLNRLVGAAFCQELNQRRKAIDPADVAAVYDLSFWAHYELVTIHPWADGNGRTCRLLMNLLQWEFDVLPTKVLKEDKAEYIQALIDTRESDLPKWLQASVSTAVLYPSI